MFIGRERELNELKEKLENRRFESLLIYGRRRIGKTALIREAASSFHGRFLYYECRRSLFSDNLDGLNRLLQRSFGHSFSFPEFRDILHFVLEKAKTERVLFVLDEFPFLMLEKPSVVSDIRDILDAYRDQSSLKLILSGSYVDMMKSLIEGNSETFGRFTGVIHLKPFDYYDAAQFYPDYTPEEKLMMYAVFGGIAFFNSLIDPQKTPLENIQQLVVQPDSILQLEIEHTISAETSKIPMVNSVIEMIGEGETKYSEIRKKLLSKLGKEVNIDYLLKKLTEMEILEKKVPINDSKNRKRTFYVFADNLMQFYYQFIFPYKAMNSIMPVNAFFQEFVENKFLERYLPLKFEKVTREYLIRANQKGLLSPPIYNIGTYFFDDARNRVNRQFDVVTQDRNGYISYECKYSASPISLSVIQEEEYQVRECGLSFYKLGFASRSGFSESVPPEKYSLLTLREMYSGKLSSDEAFNDPRSVLPK